LKRLFLIAAGLAILIAGVAALGTDRTASAGNGNGTPNGKHFTLNLIANTDKNANMNNDGGSVIFVPLECKQKGPNNSPDPSTCNETDGVVGDADCRINLQMGDYQVLDKNCTDGTAAFQLPDPCSLDNAEDSTTTCTQTAYSVWIALAGQPGGGMDMETCFTDDVSGEDFCSLENVIRMRTSGKPSWSDVSKCLLTIYADTTDDGVSNPTRTFLFDPDGDAYWWEYDNWGNLIAKLRFYPVASNISNPGVDC
jgi:hypothetical protein